MPSLQLARRKTCHYVVVKIFHSNKTSHSILWEGKYKLESRYLIDPIISFLLLPNIQGYKIIFFPQFKPLAITFCTYTRYRWKPDYRLPSVLCWFALIQKKCQSKEIWAWTSKFVIITFFMIPLRPALTPFSEGACKSCSEISYCPQNDPSSRSSNPRSFNYTLHAFQTFPYDILH